MCGLVCAISLYRRKFGGPSIGARAPEAMVMATDADHSDFKGTERALRMKFRLARGLDSQGRLLEGKMLTQAIAENERRLASWKEATNSPFNQIALYNGSRQIASCGNFFDFSRHESINELDPPAGLQIRGINRSEEEDVLLGSYALEGVQHDGEEQVLALRNGYTVGLRVVQLDEKTFAIGFSCVDSLKTRADYAEGVR